MSPHIDICAVQLPGRGARLVEPAYDSMPKLVEKIADVILGEGTQPFAFFGHSLGGLIAFELTRYLQRHYLTLPQHLIVSGCSAPQSRSSFQRIHELNDEELIDVLRKYDGTPPGVLENSELMALVLPAIRADFSLAAEYTYRNTPLLTVPITAFGGKEDAHISPSQISAWQKETSRALQTHWFAGGHFFLHSEQQALIECLNTTLSAPPA